MMMTIDNDDDGGGDDDNNDAGGGDHPDAIKKIRPTTRVGVQICLLDYSRPLGYFLSAGVLLAVSCYIKYHN